MAFLSAAHITPSSFSFLILPPHLPPPVTNSTLLKTPSLTNPPSSAARPFSSPPSPFPAAAAERKEVMSTSSSLSSLSRFTAPATRPPSRSLLASSSFLSMRALKSDLSSVSSCSFSTLFLAAATFMSEICSSCFTFSSSALCRAWATSLPLLSSSSSLAFLRAAASAALYFARRSSDASNPKNIKDSRAQPAAASFVPRMGKEDDGDATRPLTVERMLV
mmetsp:Transcript_7368/g.14547  ORF Transcript_7368/g.14547 Transcript_7368/m.14547 type:complete len:220 (-) Transcript_7368:809-1468(-)